jgi:hypothetical protein
VADVDTLSRRPLGPVDLVGRPGRAAYSFLVALLARFTYPFGSVYAAFVGINLVLWWGAALAMYDLGRRARGDWRAGWLAGLLTATGLGFTFMTGSPMSNAAAYGAAAIVLWLLERLRVFARPTRWTDQILAGVLAATAGLMYSFGPFYLGSVFFRHIGRAELRRLLLWAVVVLGTGRAWSGLLDWVAHAEDASGPAGMGYTVELLLLMGVVLALAGLGRLPRLWSEWCVAAPLVALSAAAGVLVGGGWGAALGTINAATGDLQLPHYLPGLGDMLWQIGRRSLSSWAAFNGALQLSAFDQNVLAAFPPPVCLLALVGLARLSRRWREWALAVVASGGILAFGMNAFSGVHHPRLLYIAYPGMYLLAASGLLNVYAASSSVVSSLFTLVSRLSWRPSGARGTKAAAAPREPSPGGPARPRALVRGVALAAVAACVLAAVAPSNASLWGDWSYANRFHFGGVS